MPYAALDDLRAGRQRADALQISDSIPLKAITS